MTRSADDLRLLMRHLKPGASGRGRRSTLFQWMFQRAPAFARMLDDVQPSWASVAAALTAQDLTDGAGKPPTAERARKTWFEVKRAKGWLLAPRPDGMSVPTADTRLSAPPPPLPSIAPGSNAGDDDVEFEFRTLQRPPRKD
jgi:hypothetical protein